MSVRSLHTVLRPWTCRTCLQKSPQQLFSNARFGGRPANKFGYATSNGNPWAAKEVKAQHVQSIKKPVVEVEGITTGEAAPIAKGSAKRVSQTVKKAWKRYGLVQWRSKRRRRILVAVVLGSTLVAGAVAFGDEAAHIAGAARRTGRVVGTLAVCINEYDFSLFL
jgi:hypothetical protein